jgi:hypothetical protein
MKAQDEHEALAHMASMFKQHGGQLSGSNQDWVSRKTEALDILVSDAGPQDEPLQFLDVGIGDMMPWSKWQPFLDEQVEYLGVDACPVVLQAMRKKYGTQDNVTFLELPFSELVAGPREGFAWPVDCIVALDVLYHVPDDDVYEGLLDLLFKDGTHSYALASYATDMEQKFNGAKACGQVGFAWFPRAWREPQGWDLVHRAGFIGPQRQELSLYRRAA